MYLLDEKNKDKIIGYDVIFPNKTRNVVATELYQLMSNKNLMADITAFTIAFIWNNSPHSWGLAKGYSEEEIYVRETAEKIDTGNLYFMFRKIKDMGIEKLNELYSYLATNPKIMDSFFKATYPDIAHFSSVFPLAELTPSKNNDYFPNVLSINDALNNRYNFCSDESDIEVIKEIIDAAENNNDVLRRLKLEPNIRK